MYSLLPNINMYIHVHYFWGPCLVLHKKKTFINFNHFFLTKCWFCFVFKRGDTKHYWTQMNYGALLHSFMSMRDTTTQYHGRHPIKGVMPSPMLLVFLTPRQALSSHPRQQMVWLYWLQDSMSNWCTIKHPTKLHTHNEI